MPGKIRLAFLALRELGVRQAWQYAMYQIGLRSGYYRLRTPSRPLKPEDAPGMRLESIPLPDKNELRRMVGSQSKHIISRANEIVEGKVRLFGADPVPLELNPPAAKKSWTSARIAREDIKRIWEPARFGWIFDLGRAYLLKQDEHYPEIFWTRWEEFQAQNKYNRGPNWSSGQEIALRLISLCFAARLFWDSQHSTKERTARLAASLVDHARRIPVTLAYARAQNNNHLVSEAAGLYIAGLVLQDLPEARDWKQAGWNQVNEALQTQIEDDGEYVQHSTNYHRLMLEIACLIDAVARASGEFLPSTTTERLAAATRWLLGYFDPQSGGVSNLGHNDGANPLPLAFSSYADYRPVVQAASLAFLGRQALPAGTWDEYPLWLGLNKGLYTPINSRATWRIDQPEEWASLRARSYSTRPAHADQLQVDLWYRGRDILLDPGTYSYNNNPPWDNGLAGGAVHNAVRVDNQEPMLRSGRFLWLNWAQAVTVPKDMVPNTRLSAYHDGYLPRGLRCKRTLEWQGPGSWKITDQLMGRKSDPFTAHQIGLHWLLPDGEIEQDENNLNLTLPGLQVTLWVTWPQDSVSAAWTRLVRAGKILSGSSGEAHELGWYSPTYSVLIPALSFQINLACQKPVTIQTVVQIEPTE